MITKRRAQDRGHADHGWLDSQHSFSFADYYDPKHMGFRELRVINEDRVKGGKGFGSHSHRDMEIITYVLEGALEHKDSMGNGSVMRRFDVQLMSAGSGVSHSEFNASAKDLVHFLQIWITPNVRGGTPSYAQESFPLGSRKNQLTCLVAPGTAETEPPALKIKQDCRLFAALLEAQAPLTHSLLPGRHAWVQVVSGTVRVNGVSLDAGDGAAISAEVELDIEAETPGEILLFDLP